VSTPVAIVGMACLFAGAPDLRGFRDNIFAGVDSLGEAPPGWLPDSPSAARNPLVYTTRGGWLADPVTFDSLAYGVMPASVDGSEPEHFVALRLAAEALADAGYDERPFPRETTGVILGRGTYVNRAYVSVVQHRSGSTRPSTCWPGSTPSGPPRSSTASAPPCATRCPPSPPRRPPASRTA
jgi:acyl transferase domain-containing protein